MATRTPNWRGGFKRDGQLITINLWERGSDGRLVGRAGDKSAAHSITPFFFVRMWMNGRNGFLVKGEIVVTLLSLLFPFWTNAECPGEGQSEMLRRMAMDLERVRKQRVPLGRLIGEGRKDHQRLMGTFLDKFHGVRGGSTCSRAVSLSLKFDP